MVPSTPAITSIDGTVRAEPVVLHILCSKREREAKGQKVFGAVVSNELGSLICQSEVILFIFAIIFYIFYWEAECTQWWMSSLFCHGLNVVHLSVSRVSFIEINVAPQGIMKPNP